MSTGNTTTTAGKQNLHTLKTLWLRRNLVLGLFLLTLLFGGLFFTLLTPLYTAAASLQLYPKEYDIANIEAVKSETPIYPDSYEEVESIIRSPQIIKPVIQRLKLSERGEFNKDLIPVKTLAEKLEHKIKVTFGFDRRESKPLEELIFNQIQKELNITKEPYFKIDIHYTSISPYLARAITNAVLDKYMEYDSDNVSKKIIIRAELPPKPSYPDKWPIFSFFATAGLLVGVIFAWSLNGPGKITLEAN